MACASESKRERWRCLSRQSPSGYSRGKLEHHDLQNFIVRHGIDNAGGEACEINTFSVKGSDATTPVVRLRVQQN